VTPPHYINFLPAMFNSTILYHWAKNSAAHQTPLQHTTWNLGSIHFQLPTHPPAKILHIKLSFSSHLFSSSNTKSPKALMNFTAHFNDTLNVYAIFDDCAD